jgi:hypothetical protein
MFWEPEAQKAVEPTSHGLKCLKPWTKISLSSFKVDHLRYFITVRGSELAHTQHPLQINCLFKYTLQYWFLKDRVLLFSLYELGPNIEVGTQLMLSEVLLNEWVNPRQLSWLVLLQMSCCTYFVGLTTVGEVSLFSGFGCSRVKDREESWLIGWIWASEASTLVVVTSPTWSLVL